MLIIKNYKHKSHPCPLCGQERPILAYSYSIKTDALHLQRTRLACCFVSLDCGAAIMSGVSA